MKSASFSLPVTRKRRTASATTHAEQLGQRLRRLRQQQGLSLRRLAEKVGVTATALHLWESGRRNPKQQHLQAFADAFRLTRAELIRGTEAGDQASPDPAVPAAATFDQSSHLAAEIAACKERIAAVAGTSIDRVRIVIEI
jgi:transcriptional regulator with XRE-family HTH domain